MIYLAAPYSHENYFIRQRRFRAVCIAAARLMGEGKIIFSPISHTHPIAEYGGLPTGWEYWEKYDREMLAVCSEIVVLKLDGWDKSTGVAAEMRIAKELGKPISFMEWD